MTLQGKRIVITGAAGALGRGVSACARALGADAVLLDLAFPADAPADGSLRLCVDLGDAGATAACFGQIGPVDGLFNLAGGFAMGPRTWEVADDEWAQMYQINVATTAERGARGGARHDRARTRGDRERGRARRAEGPGPHERLLCRARAW